MPRKGSVGGRWVSGGRAGQGSAVSKTDTRKNAFKWLFNWVVKRPLPLLHPLQPHPCNNTAHHRPPSRAPLAAALNGDNWVLWLTRQLCFLNWHKFQYVALWTTQTELKPQRHANRNETNVLIPEYSIHIHNTPQTIHNPSSCAISRSLALSLAPCLRARLSVSAINCAINFNYCYFAGTHWEEWQLEWGIRSQSNLKQCDRPTPDTL